MTFIETTPEARAEGAVADMYEGDLALAGYVRNLVKAFSAAPEVYAAWVQLNSAIKARMDLRRYELATLAAARPPSGARSQHRPDTRRREPAGEHSSLSARTSEPESGPTSARTCSTSHRRRASLRATRRGRSSGSRNRGQCSRARSAWTRRR